MHDKGVKIKVLGIAGSPRKKGNTEYVLQFAIDEAKRVGEELRKFGIEVETEYFSMAGKEFLQCISGFKCARLEGRCSREGVYASDRVNEPDAFGELRDKWYDADVVLFACPVYHMRLPSNVSAFLDRLGCTGWWAQKERLQRHFKVYGTIVQGEHLWSGQRLATTDLIHHALLMGNIVVAGDSWENYAGACGWTENRLDVKALKELYEEKKTFDSISFFNAIKSQVRRAVQLGAIIKLGALQLLDYLKTDESFEFFVKRLTDQPQLPWLKKESR